MIILCKRRTVIIRNYTSSYFYILFKIHFGIINFLLLHVLILLSGYAQTGPLYNYITIVRDFTLKILYSLSCNLDLALYMCKYLIITFYLCSIN